MADQPRILIVEDEPRLRCTLARSLAARHYRVDEVGTVADAVRAAIAGNHDAVLLDVNLPDGAGWDVLRALRRAGLARPAIVLSGGTPNPERVREFRTFGVLPKPFPIDALLHLVKAAVGSPQEESPWSFSREPAPSCSSRPSPRSVALGSASRRAI
jgi:DNA-binding response OmpR family regulator